MTPRWLLTTALLVLGVALAVSRLNPLATNAADDRLERRCAEDASGSSTYDRSSWTPLRWSCTVTGADGNRRIIHAW